MKTLKLLGKTLFWILILGILLCPGYLIFQLSEAEMAEYKTPPPPVILDSAYGEICQASRGDLEEFVTVSGSYVCKEYAYMELDYRDPSMIRWEVSDGDVIFQDQVLGYYKGDPVISTVTGVIAQIQTYGTEAHIQVKLLAPTVLECKVNDAVLHALHRSEGLRTQEGAVITLSYESPVKNSDGTTTITLTTETPGIYGSSVDELVIYTGRVYTGVLMLDADCVYQKEQGEDNPWFVRQVSADGIYQKEVEVELGYMSGDWVCVTGVNEGDWFDSGYKQVLAGDDK